MIVPESTVIKPHISEAMLLAFWPDQSCTWYEKRYHQTLFFPVTTRSTLFQYQIQFQRMSKAFYLKHYHTCNNSQSCEHDIIYWGNNCRVECIQRLEQRSHIYINEYKKETCSIWKPSTKHLERSKYCKAEATQQTNSDYGTTRWLP